MTEPPLQEGIHRPQVPAPAVRPTDSGRFPRIRFQFLHELLDVEDRARQLIDDRDCCSLRGPGKRVQVDADDGFPHADQRFRSVAVLQRDEHDIRPEDPVPVGESSLRLDAWDPCVGAGA